MPIQDGVSSLAASATITAEALAALIAERDALAGALRIATTERDLALERLRSLQRQLFAAKSEARGTDQKDLFLNEAEALAPTDQTPPAQGRRLGCSPMRRGAAPCTRRNSTPASARAPRS